MLLAFIGSATSFSLEFANILRPVLQSKLQDYCFSTQDCPHGWSLFQGRCFGPCKEGFKEEADRCIGVCAEGFKDQGFTCLKQGSYGRGVGYFDWHLQQCQKENPQGCQKNGLLYYPKCVQGYQPFGCCICVKQCPYLQKDGGLTCSKREDYYRAGPEAPGCPKQCGGLCALKSCDEKMSRLQVKDGQIEFQGGSLKVKKCE